MAQPRTRHESCIVIGRTKLGESDLILTLLQKDGSQAQAIAKGARKPSAKLAAKTQVFSEFDALIAKGRSLDILSEAQLTQPHKTLRGSPERVSAASVVCELARYTSFEDSTDAFLYPICSRALLACEEAEAQASLDLVVAAYAFKVLSHQGWRPILSTCCACGDTAPTRFSAQAGGALCESCSKDIEGADLVDAQTLSLINTLISSTFDEILTISANTETASFVLALAHNWCATHLDARLKAFEFMLGIMF